MDSYMLLRRLILDGCNYKGTFDDLTSTPETIPYFKALDSGINPTTVVDQFIQEHVQLKKFWVVVDNTRLPVSVSKSNFKGKVVGVVRRLEKGNPRAVNVSKKLIICLANLQKMLREGEKTIFVKSKPKKAGKEHKGSKWIYVRDLIVEPGLKGRAVLEIEFPPVKEDPNQPRGANKLYHATVKGAVGFASRNGTVENHLDLLGQVVIEVED